MDKSIKRAKLFILSFLILNIFIVYFTIYLPINSELKKSKQEVFLTLADSKIISIDNYLESCKTGAESMSSRTMIRKKIVEYYDGEIDFEELRNYTKDLYADGVEALDNSTGAVRLVEEKIVASHGELNLNLVDKSNYSKSVDLEILSLDSGHTVIVYSPIYENYEILGYDVVFYNMDNIIESISLTNVNASITDEIMSEYDKKIILREDEELLVKDDIIHHYHRLEGTDKNILFQISTKDLYADLRKIIIYNVLGAFIGLGVLAYLSNKFIISNAKRLLDRALEERNEFENHAKTDSLTGAYSRMFLDHWSERNLNEFEGHLILIDLDCFKKINDKFGHLTGDKVLVKFVEIVKSSIRDEDYLIRYGGDEFIIITDNEDREIVESIVNRIKEKCQSVDEFSFDILMSYGIAKIEGNDDINKTIYKADKALYKNKEKRECKEI
ncbi:GGDEF domain-containing protein [Halanaerobium sp.]|uniref:GGDEF domain-containing protein n=1 Tax=Halanaerobium sp. TaxID=1895664 RepID=UPI000DE71A40|nr:GGDEF domain-containing protein [Halanaerobium sp.]PUU87457.1 MAG: diguanylate cyclase [Halanaerobium sp.]